MTLQDPQKPDNVQKAQTVGTISGSQVTCSNFSLSKGSFIKSVEVSQSASGIEHMTVLGSEGEFRVWGQRTSQAGSWTFSKT